MKLAGIRPLVNEGRSIQSALRDETTVEHTGPLVVTGMLAEQLAKELAAGAAPGAVVARAPATSAGAGVLVHVLAGEPSDADQALVREADGAEIPVVIVQLWPQADWTPPFVLSPFVVECRAGEGFPVREIADRIADAVSGGHEFASCIPALADAVRAAIVRQTVIRTALIGLAGSRLGVSRPLISLEQVRMVSRLRAVTSGTAVTEELPALAAAAAGLVASGFAFRRVARSAGLVLPRPVANAAVAALGTWALAKAAGVVEARLPSG